MKNAYYFSRPLKAKIVLILITVIIGLWLILGSGQEAITSLLNSEDKLLSRTEENQESIVLRLAEPMPQDYPSTKSMAYFSELVSEKSQGHLKIKIYHTGELGSEASVLEQVQFGGIAMARVSATTLANKVEGLEPYLNPASYEDKDTLMDNLNHEHTEISDLCQKERYVILSWLFPDQRCFYSDEIAVDALSDLKDQLVYAREGAFMKAQLEKFGLTVVSGESADIYKSMRSGYMDIGEASLGEVMSNENYRFFGYFTLSDYLAIPDVLLIGAEEYSVLSNDDRQLLLDCAREAAAYYKLVLEQQQVKWQTQLVEDHKEVVTNQVLNEAMKNLFGKGGEVYE